MSGTEGQDPRCTDRIDLQLSRGATGSGREESTPQSTAPVTDTKSLLQVTPYHGDKASFLGWKWCFLIAVRAISKPLYEGVKKIEDNMNQDFRKSIMTPWRPDMQFAIRTSPQSHNREQARSETVDTISQRHATHLSSSLTAWNGSKMFAGTLWSYHVSPDLGAVFPAGIRCRQRQSRSTKRKSPST